MGRFISRFGSAVNGAVLRSNCLIPLTIFNSNGKLQIGSGKLQDAIELKNKYISDTYIMLSLIRDLTNVCPFSRYSPELMANNSGTYRHSQIANQCPWIPKLGDLLDQRPLGVEDRRLWNGRLSNSSDARQKKYNSLQIPNS